ncbi:MAG: hypothetical protein JWO39_2945 [Gemmatimonadetes bacterium]|nr:hypothetical protein [Gemmatimonadota bacterium]
MTLDTSAMMRWGGARLLVLCALVIGSTTACDRRYSHGRIPVDRDTKRRWNASENEAEDVGKQLIPIPADDGKPDDLVPPEALKNALAPVVPSERHGAGDKRLLSSIREGRAVSSDIVAEIVLVKGSEYKSESDFRKGWIPIAILHRPPDEGRSVEIYTKLRLRPTETSWIFVRKRADATWAGSIVWLQGGVYKQDTMFVTTENMSYSKQGKADSENTDLLEPVIGARFVWQKNDETMWAYCGGKCCSMRGIK